MGRRGHSEVASGNIFQSTNESDDIFNRGQSIKDKRGSINKVSTDVDNISTGGCNEVEESGFRYNQLFQIQFASSRVEGLQRNDV